MATCKSCLTPIETLKERRIRFFRNNFCDCDVSEKVLCSQCIVNIGLFSTDKCQQCKSHLKNIFFHREPVTLQQFDQWFVNNIRAMVQSKPFKVLFRLMLGLDIVLMAIVYGIMIRPKDNWSPHWYDHLNVAGFLVSVVLTPALLLILSLALLMRWKYPLLIRWLYHLFMYLHIGPKGRIIRMHVVEKRVTVLTLFHVEI